MLHNGRLELITVIEAIESILKYIYPDYDNEIVNINANDHNDFCENNDTNN